MLGPVVIVGGGIGAISAATGIRLSDPAIEIIIVSEEDELPYDRTQLSKEFLLSGETPSFRLNLDQVTNLRWIGATRVEKLNTELKSVELSNGQAISYSTLVLATGATPRMLPNLTDIAVPVTALRTLRDASFIRKQLQPSTSLVIIGAGVIGLELASSARALGTDVTIIETLPHVMSRCAPPTLSSFVAAYHLRQGVTIHLGCQIEQAKDTILMLNNGLNITADLVVVGVGVEANDSIAKAAGIACDDGIFVDGYGRTTCPSVFAVGDVTRQLNASTGHFARIETWSNAQNQALALGRNLANGSFELYSEVPWYWSDQYDLQIQVAGASNGAIEIVRGSLDEPNFSIFQIHGNRIVGVSCVNRPRDFAISKRLIANHAVVERENIGNPAFDLRTYI
jgi:3-phenylpropionate/trans-cinnamate dioxygenase ferredoxin reductase component